MATLLSPGVQVTEIDASKIVPSVSSTTACFVGSFTKGPVLIPTLITSVDELIEVFGQPYTGNTPFSHDSKWNEWYQAYNFLQYSNTLWITRVVPSSNTKATLDISVSGTGAAVFAKWPGAWGNDISVEVIENTSFISYQDNLDPMDSSTFNDANKNALDASKMASTWLDAAIVVKYKGVINEIHYVSYNDGDLDENGKTAYLPDVLERDSALIEHSSVSGEDFDETAEANLSGGTENAYGVGDIPGAYLEGYETFSNKEDIDIDIVIGNEVDGGQGAATLAETRQDCLAFIGSSIETALNQPASYYVHAIINERKSNADGAFDTDSQFVVLGGNYKLQYDRYTGKDRWINVAGDLAGLRAQTSSNRASWWASAGLERGQVKNVKKLMFNPSQAQRDLLYKFQVNPVVTFPGQGTVVWGQKTATSTPSSFDRVNVRGLFNTVERALGKMAKFQVMEFNDNFTRNRIVSMIKPFLSTVQAGRGIQDFLVICDETNNTPDVISRNQLIVDVYIKPTYVAEFIHLRFTNAGTNAFSEIVG